MARRAHEEYIRIWWVTTISSKTAPTTTEINAGTDVTTFVPKDGLKIGGSNDKVKNDDISSSHKSEIPGAYGESIALTCFRDDAADSAWTLFKTRNTAGYLVVRRMVPFATAATAAQKVEVYPATTLQPVPMDTAENERQKFTVEFAVTAPPALDATVA